MASVKKIFPDFKNKVVLDLGCGYGWHCYYAARQGAMSVLGIDQSVKMIQEAMNRNLLPNIEYRVCDLFDYDYPLNTFDCVISNLALHYIENLDRIYKCIYRTLKKGGTFVMNIEHPTFTAGVHQQWIEDNNQLLYWPIDNYFYSGIRKTDFLGYEVMKYHHTLTEILQGLLDCGFVIEQVQEATPSLEMMENPEMKDEMRRPMMSMVKVKK